MSKVTDYLAHMEGDITNPDMWTKEQAEAWANEYWQIRWNKSLSVEEMQVKIGDHSERFKPVREVRVNQQGNTVIHRNRSADRYLFDFDDDFRAAGWLQFDTDQDAWYYGVWVNPKTLRTLSYCEGDVYLVICPDVEHYNAEIKAACEFHGEGFEFIACEMEAFTALMLGGEVKGEAEIHRQDRSKFFVMA
ncbi:MAG: hypothetical protein ACLP9L_15935 [Thermoguttaceae bacterium]